jgi:hypothetical protein
MELTNNKNEYKKQWILKNKEKNNEYFRNYYKMKVLKLGDEFRMKNNEKVKLNKAKRDENIIKRPIGRPKKEINENEIIKKPTGRPKKY